MLSVQKLIQKLGNTRNYNCNPVDKIKIAAEYIALNMEEAENNQELLNELIFVTKKNVAETILHQTKEANFKMSSTKMVPPSSKFDAEKASTTLSMFMLAPETTFKKIVEDEIKNKKELDNVNIISNTNDINKKEKYMALNNFLANKDDIYSTYELNNYQITNDKYNIIQNVYKDNYYKEDRKDPIADAINGCKGGFFERLFRTTSNEYRNFETMLKRRMNGTASREELNNAAKAYLIHKIPNFSKTGRITDEDLNRLSSTAKDRAYLCYQTLLATEKSNNYETKLDSINMISNANLKENGMLDTLKQMRIDNGNEELNNSMSADSDSSIDKDVERDDFLKDLDKIVNEDVKTNNELFNKLTQDENQIDDNQIDNKI